MFRLATKVSSKALIRSKNKNVAVVMGRPFSTMLERAKRLQTLALEREQRAQGDETHAKDIDPAMAIFDEIDLNGDGSISREEFRMALEKMRHLDLQQMKRSLLANDIAFSHKAFVMGKRVIVGDQFSPWQFIKSLPQYKYVQHLCPPVALPPKESTAPPLTLVLDMDETILHCSVEVPCDGGVPPDHSFKVRHQGKSFMVHAWLRPGLQEFLDKIYGRFEVVIFTASTSTYANEILNLIDPEKKYFHHRLFRESCIDVEDNHVKDLNVLGRDLSQTILVDNSPHVFGYQVDNGVPIKSWYADDPTDNELEKLEWFLRELDEHIGKDVRIQIRNKFQCHKLIEDAQIDGYNTENDDC